MPVQDDYIMTSLRAQAEVFSAPKAMAMMVASALEETDLRGGEAIRSCSTQAAMKWCPACGRSHISGTWQCRHRLCPVCQLRRSRHNASAALAAIDHLEKSGALRGTRMYLLTMTQRNVPDGSLCGEIDNILAALTRMRHARAFRSFVIGSARNIEVTRNYKANTWHPHVHVVLILRDGHPGMDKPGFWSALWADLMSLSYMPITDIRPITDNGAVFEISKYVSKCGEIVKHTPQHERAAVIGELNLALHSRNCVAYTGVWRAARRDLKLSDDFALEDDVDALCACGGPLVHAMMTWDGCKYVIGGADGVGPS